MYYTKGNETFNDIHKEQSSCPFIMGNVYVVVGEFMDQSEVLAIEVEQEGIEWGRMINACALLCTDERTD